jgi:hypothetical protein
MCECTPTFADIDNGNRFLRGVISKVLSDHATTSFNLWALVTFACNELPTSNRYIREAMRTAVRREIELSFVANVVDDGPPPGLGIRYKYVAPIVQSGVENV